VKRLVLTEIARSDLESIRRYSERTWGAERTVSYMAALRETLKRLRSGQIAWRKRDDLRPDLKMATSGRHRVFFEDDDSRVLVIRVLHDRMDYRRHLDAEDTRPDDQE
jgi:toxin ParE1/3/4